MHRRHPEELARDPAATAGRDPSAREPRPPRLGAPARYFVVGSEPFRMAPGLSRLGRDFGNGATDGLVFQRDRLAADYRRQKEKILAAHPERLQALSDTRADELARSAFDWMCSRLREEHDIAISEGPEPDFRALTLAVQEDFALLAVDPSGADRTTLLSVCFPSGWRPEALLGQSFIAIHAGVPEFAAVSRQASKLVRAMVERGPYVRFVWSLTADARLDHHPDHAPRDAWSSDCEGTLRVERQVTVPLPAASGSLFLIRTYLYSLRNLATEERATIRDAVLGMSSGVLAYKGLDAGLAEIVRRLER